MSIRASIFFSMDEFFELHGITFVWDREKARKSLVKHGVTFQQAAEVFLDPFIRMVDASSEDEARDAIIGMDTHWNLLFVVHLILEEDRVRVISARRADRNQRRFYEA